MRLLPALALTAASSMAIAQSPGPRPPPSSQPATLEVTGEAQVSEEPDRVYIDIGVMTRAQRSQQATSQNAARISAVVAAVKRVAGPSARLTTTEYSVSPSYHYPHDGGTPAIVGYSASNVVRVRLDDLTRIGRVIDAATQAGSNRIQDIRFALRDEEPARTQALREAALKARQNAQALADALGLRLVRVLAVNEQSPLLMPGRLYPQTVAMQAARAGPATPVEPGTIEIDATVNLTVEVAPAKR